MGEEVDGEGLFLGWFKSLVSAATSDEDLKRTNYEETNSFVGFQRNSEQEPEKSRQPISSMEARSADVVVHRSAHRVYYMGRASRRVPLCGEHSRLARNTNFGFLSRHDSKIFSQVKKIMSRHVERLGKIRNSCESIMFLFRNISDS